MDVNIAAVLAFAFATAVSPGPNNVMIMVSGVNYGVRRSMPHYLGICFGFPAMLLAMGLSLGQVMTQFSMIHPIIQVLGILYLLWLAWKIATAKPEIDALNTGEENTASGSKPLTFFQAALFQWVNGKAWVMVTGAIATYTVIDPTVQDSDWVMAMQVLVITSCFLMVGFFSAGIWLMGGVALKPWLSREHWLIRFNQIMGVLLALSVLPVVWEVIADFYG